MNKKQNNEVPITHWIDPSTGLPTNDWEQLPDDNDPDGNVFDAAPNLDNSHPKLSSSEARIAPQKPQPRKTMTNNRQAALEAARKARKAANECAYHAALAASRGDRSLEPAALLSHAMAGIADHAATEAEDGPDTEAALDAAAVAVSMANGAAKACEEKSLFIAPHTEGIDTAKELLDSLEGYAPDDEQRRWFYDYSMEFPNVDRRRAALGDLRADFIFRADESQDAWGETILAWEEALDAAEAAKEDKDD